MDFPKRKSSRLKGYDYSTNGAYFITICTDKRKNLFSHIVGAIHESPISILTFYGTAVDSIIKSLPERFNVKIDNYIIMPNHIHMIISIENAPRAIRESPLQSHSDIIRVIGYLKMNASKQIHKSGYEGKIWQRSFHDHIIRDEKDYQMIWEYIEHNAQKWEEDCFYTNE